MIKYSRLIRFYDFLRFESYEGNVSYERITYCDISRIRIKFNWCHSLLFSIALSSIFNVAYDSYAKRVSPFDIDSIFCKILTTRRNKFMYVWKMNYHLLHQDPYNILISVYDLQANRCWRSPSDLTIRIPSRLLSGKDSHLPHRTNLWRSIRRTLSTFLQRPSDHFFFKILNIFLIQFF